MPTEKYDVLIRLLESNNITLAKQWIRSKNIDTKIMLEYCDVEFDDSIKPNKAIAWLKSLLIKEDNLLVTDKDKTTCSCSAPKFIVAEKTASQVCNIMGTSCNPPISFFLNSDNSLGFKVQIGNLNEVSDEENDADIEDVSMAEFKKTPIYKEIQDGKYVTVVVNGMKNGLDIFCKVDINLTDILIGDTKLDLVKEPYALGYLYKIKIDDPERYINVVTDAFIIAIAPIVEDIKKHPPKEPEEESPFGMEEPGGLDFGELT